MNIIVVRHPGSKKEYFFEVSDEILAAHPHIRKGTPLLCSTRRGVQRGFAQRVITGDVSEILAAHPGAKLPLAKVVAVAEVLDLKTVKIPNHFKRTIPSAEKISKRLNEYRSDRMFRTSVKVENGKLVDGYSAYLVCRMLGRRFLPYCTESEAVRKPTA